MLLLLQGVIVETIKEGDGKNPPAGSKVCVFSGFFLRPAAPPVEGCFFWRGWWCFCRVAVFAFAGKEAVVGLGDCII